MLPSPAQPRLGPGRAPRTLVEELERRRDLSPGSGERVLGYGVLGLPFASGHVLAFRRLVATSIGPDFTSVWHRSPSGSWTFYVDGDPRLGCPRYFGSALDRVVVGGIDLSWIGPDTLSISVPGGRLDWILRLRSTLATRTLEAIGRVLPDAAWEHDRVLAVLESVASRALAVQGLRLGGSFPNGQWYRMRPLRLWRVEGSAAVTDGRELGSTGPLPSGARLGPFPVPDGGLFALGHAVTEPLDPRRHRTSLGREIVAPSEAQRR